MRALIVDQAGGPFRSVEVAQPVPAAGEVLVRIRASGVNPLDTKIRAGKAGHAKQPLPAILGIDLAGEVAEVGPAVSGFKRGDRVYGMAGGVGGHQGSLAEFAAVDARLLASMPDRFSMREAAALPLAFITAWEGLVDRAGVRAGQKVLVQGGAGGVGHVAIQIARRFGAEVYATSSAGKRQIVERSGATAIDYNTRTVEQYVADFTGGAGFDIVYDSVGGPVLDASFAAVGRFGHVVSALGWGTHALAPLSFKAATYSGIFTLLPLLTGVGREHHGDIMREATRLAQANQLRVNLDPRTFTLDTVLEAHTAIASGDASGKLVVEVA
jgi:NADPH2:quinone reductase